MSRKDFVGDVFRRAEAVGEWIRFPVWARVAPGAETELVEFSHADFDAIGAVASWLRERGIDPGELPAIRETREPDLVARILLSLAPVRHPLSWRVAWRRFDRAFASRGPEDARPRARAWRVLSRERTEALEARAREAGVSLNSYLLWGLHDALAGRLAEPGTMKFRLWMIPVNLRNAVRLARDTMNHASFVPLPLADGISPREVHAAVRERLARREHWKAWYGAAMLKFVPGFFVMGWMRRYYRREGHSWTGVFSNVGEWNVPALPGLELALAPPPTKAQPLCAAAIKVNGRLSLALQAHPALSRDPAEAEAWLGAWIQRLGA